MRMLRPTPASHHNKEQLFVRKDIYECSHVLLRTDAVKRPLGTQYTGPYEVINREYLIVYLQYGSNPRTSMYQLRG